MPISIDHIVIAVKDLGQASADYAAAGFTVTPGGEHTGGATHNSLVSFADGTYFELIAIKDPSKITGHRFFTLLEKGDGSVAFALLSADLAVESAAISARGLQTVGPRIGGRLRPDGQQVDWRTLQLESDPEAPLPFLIDDQTPRVLRVPDGAATKHPLGDLTVSGITIAVADLAATSTVFTKLLSEGADVTSSVPGVAAARRFAVGSQWIDLAQPSDGSEIGAFQGERGDGLFQIHLAGGASASELPFNLTHGVHISVAS